ncbi:MAG: MFS transporter [Gammaproteobacteria bacterium]|nr:MFS transporter [Gammaproteobacteria bacterium]
MIFKRYPAFYLSCLLAFTAGHMINYSVIMYAQEVLGSDLLSGVGFGLCFGPPIVLGWYAGVLCDRLAPVRLIHYAQAVFVAAAILLLVADTMLPSPASRVAPFLMAATFAGVGWSFVSPARMAAVTQVVKSDELRAGALALNLLVMLGFGLGPLMIGVIRSVTGWWGVFAVAATFFVAGSGLLLGIETHRSNRPPRHVMHEIREGLVAIVRRPLLGQFMLAAIVGYLAMGPMQVLLPRLANTQFALGDLGRGLFLGTLAIALMVGGVGALKFASGLPAGISILVATTLVGSLLAAIGFAGRAAAAVALLFGVGVAGGFALSLIVAGIQVNSDEAVRGRVLATYTVISQVIPAASGLAAGALSQWLGARQALIACGATIAFVTLANSLWMRALRKARH